MMQPAEPHPDDGPPHGAPGPHPVSGRPPGRKKPSRRWALIGAGGVVALAAAGGVGYAIGSNGTSSAQQSQAQAQAQLGAVKSQLRTTDQQLSSVQGQVQSDHGQVVSADSRMAAAQHQAATAQATAQSQAKAAYASRMTSLQQAYTTKMASLQQTYDAKESSLRQQQQNFASTEKTVDTEAGQLQASSISSDGVYVVGQDIKPGTWHTPGDGGQNDDGCYYATLSGDNTSDASDINSNNNFDGPETVDVSGSYAFQISGGCTWYLSS
jgi:hypothetical protein